MSALAFLRKKVDLQFHLHLTLATSSGPQSLLHNNRNGIDKATDGGGGLTACVLNNSTHLTNTNNQCATSLRSAILDVNAPRNNTGGSIAHGATSEETKSLGRRGREHYGQGGQLLPLDRDL
jgi:hypothetical protein